MSSDALAEQHAVSSVDCNSKTRRRKAHLTQVAPVLTVELTNAVSAIHRCKWSRQNWVRRYSPSKALLEFASTFRFRLVAASKSSRTLTLLPLLGVLAWQSPVRAACDAIHSVPEFYVGDSVPASPTYDPLCTHNDIQSAIDAATCSYGTNIFVTREHTYTNQHLTIENKNVTLIARGDGAMCGPASVVICNPVCAPPPTGPLGVIAGGGDSVFAIMGTSKVTLRYFDITGATHAGDGGGIDFEGSGSLTLDASWVGHNNADNGGGIFFFGTGTGPPFAVLTLLAHSKIVANTASGIIAGSGGGILVEGNSVLTMVEPDTQIDNNQAPNGYGGGIDVIGPAQADIGSPDSENGESVLNQNSAAYGGGMAIVAAGANVAHARLFTTDVSKPIGITRNKASAIGGGIYVDPSHRGLQAWDYRIEANEAPEGAAVYASADSAAYINDADIQLGDALSGDPGVVCTNSALCNTINFNQASDAGGNLHSAILIESGGSFEGNRFSARHNNVAHVLRVVGDHTRADLSECLIADNGSPDVPIYTRELIYASGNDTPIHISSCTIVNDTIGSAYVIRSGGALDVNDSIIDEPGTLTVDYSGNPGDLYANYVLSNDITTLPNSGPGNGTDVVLGTPTFVDLAGGDYHLQISSLGIDYAPATVYPDVADLDGNWRNVNLNLPSGPHNYGPHDLGAFELQNRFVECGAADSIFCDGFGP